MVESSAVVISTIQRVFAALKGERIEDEDNPGLDGYIPDRPVEVICNAQMPPEAFDLVIVDEAHRSIYGVWRAVHRDSAAAGRTPPGCRRRTTPHRPGPAAVEAPRSAPVPRSGGL